MQHDLLNTIGNTPIVEITKLTPNPKVKIFAKLEYMNPGGSIKDRIARSMILDGEKKGELTSDKIIIEATSGNTGIGLALVCAIKKYKLIIAMPETASEERKQILKAMGAQLILTPASLGTDGAIEEVYNIAREKPNLYFMTDQFNNPANWQAHYYGTANEIWEQTNKQATTVIATMGTTGTVMGLSRRLKELNNKIKIVGVEPYLGHKIQGLKNMKEAYCPELYQKELLDEKINIDDEEAFETTRQLAKHEGLFVGMSSGAALSIAQKQAENMESGVIVVIFPDGGERYLSANLFMPKAKTNIRFFNTIAAKKENFVSLKADEISVYSSGPVAFSKIDLNECRRYILADIVCRYFKFLNFGVKHIIDITDIDDKIIEASSKANRSTTEFARENIEKFKQDLKTLNIAPATNYPKSSEHIEDMITLSKKLFEKGFAYEKLRSLYFDISKCKDYGKLSRINLDKIKIGATVDLDSYEKNNPKDFTLFKRAKLSELKRGIYTKTNWGNVRPCWHIQSAAIAAKYLGETFDIHISSKNLIFPHNENKLAIAKSATGKLPAKYWIDCAKIIFDGKEINKENNFYTVEDLLQKWFTGKEIRYWLMATHYAKPLTLSDQRLNYRKKGLARINRFINSLINIKNGKAYPETEQICYDIKNDFITAMDDDLNISAALASIFINIKKINGLLADKKLNKADANKIIEVFKKINTVLQIFDFDKTVYNKEIEALIKKREDARKNKDWATADKIREELESVGINIFDKKI